LQGTLEKGLASWHLKGFVKRMLVAGREEECSRRLQKLIDQVVAEAVAELEDETEFDTDSLEPAAPASTDPYADLQPVVLPEREEVA
jgi:tRNA(Ser,Leu) C12 N-acetylase TAN1